MSVRVRLREPESRRGRREKTHAEPEAEAALITFPENLDTVEEIFASIVQQLTEAGMPLKQKDAISVQTVASAYLALRRTEKVLFSPDVDDKVLAKLISVHNTQVSGLMKYLQAIGATPIVNLKVNLKPKSTNPAESALNDLFTP